MRKQNGEKPVIGVNSFVMTDEVHEIETHPYDPDTAKRQIARTQRVRAERDNAKIEALLARLVETAKDDTQNIMPVTIELVENGATMGDIVETLKGALGHLSREPGILKPRLRTARSHLIKKT